MNRIIRMTASIVVISMLAATLTGCETLKKKFIRKSKDGKKVTPVLMPQDYKGMYPNDVLYNNHFTYWRTWTEDLMDCLATQGSNKRQVLAATRAVEDLQRMQELLKSPKKEELDKYIKFYEGVLKKIDLGQPDGPESARLRSDLESRRRVIMRDFETKSVKGFILRDEEPAKPIQTIEQTLPKKE